MKHHQTSVSYTERMKNYYRELSCRVRAGEELPETERFLRELRDLMAEANPQPELRRVANGGWA